MGLKDKPVADWIGLLGDSGTVVQQARHLLTLQRHVSEAVPKPLAAACQVYGCKNGILTVATPNGAVATKLRQMLPTLLDKIKSRDQEVTQIVVTVQAVVPPFRPVPQKQAVLPDSGVASFAELAQRLPPSDLQRAIDRLASRHRKGGKLR